METYGKVLLRNLQYKLGGNYIVKVKKKYKLVNLLRILLLFILTFLSTSEKVKKHVITNFLLCNPVY